jgi:uncharacterized membrane protein
VSEAAHDGHKGMGSESPAMDMSMPHGLATPGAHFFAALIIGVWLALSPFAFDYGSTALTWSDVISGGLVVLFATITLMRRSVWAPWANSLVGVWLLFAPLVFEAPTAAAYANDTLVGSLVIVLVLLMPGMPGMSMTQGPDVPPGWSYNPSSWPQRAPIIALAFVGFFLSRQMAAFQLGYTSSVWEPFFDPGTRAVLESDVSRAFPISDAGLGAVAYIVEALMGFMGDRQRWRTMPWMVTFFGILVVPLGVISIMLIVLQPLAVGAWCTPCLVAAGAMLLMIALTLDEVIAMGQFLVQARREGQPLWRTFWAGGSLQDLPATVPVRPDVVSGGAMVWGVALPWSLLLSVLVGLVLMASPEITSAGGDAANSDQLLGALIVTVAMIALADVGRITRFLNILFGAWVVIAPWILDGATSSSTLSAAIAGVLVILLSLPRGPVGERYGTWQGYIR